MATKTNKRSKKNKILAISLFVAILLSTAFIGWRHLFVSKQIRDLRVLVHQLALPKPTSRQETMDGCTPGWLTKNEHCDEDAIILTYAGNRTSDFEKEFLRKGWQRMNSQASDLQNEVRFDKDLEGTMYCSRIYFESFDLGTNVYMSAGTACGKTTLR